MLHSLGQGLDSWLGRGMSGLEFEIVFKAKLCR